MLLFKIYLTTCLLLLAAPNLATSYPTPTGCTPFGVRLALGRSYFDSSDV